VELLVVLVDSLHNGFLFPRKDCRSLGGGGGGGGNLFDGWRLFGLGGGGGTGV
jgi:hypothetical protein